MNARYRQAGFSLIEVLVVVVIFSIVIMAASQSFVPLLSQSKQQSKIAATNIEGMLGLEMMRRDITHAGYGLYWQLDPVSTPTPSPTYTEVTAADDANGFELNDPDGIPLPIAIGGGVGWNGSDRIAIKSINAALNELSERWTYRYGSPINAVQTWLPANENISADEYVVVVRPDNMYRYLLFTNEATPVFSAQYKDVAAKYNAETTSIVFSLGTNTAPRLAFNRADYFIDNTNVPQRCAQGTGVLRKAVVDLKKGSIGFLKPYLPLLDCVADMQVAFRFDDPLINGSMGYADNAADADGVLSLQPSSAEEARQIREVRVYILAQEGQMDRNYTYAAPISPSSIRVGEAGLYGRDFDLNATITDWQRYRWKLYTLIINPICLLDWTVK